MKHKTQDVSQTKDIIRTIIENFLSGATRTVVQTATLTETGTKDLVTSETKWNNDWTTGEWQKFTPAIVPGYTPSEAEVPVVSVKNGQKNVIVTIIYNPKTQTGKIIYQDPEGNEVGAALLTGETDKTVKIDPKSKLPAGWEIVPGQNIPKTVPATAYGIPTIIVKVQQPYSPETPAPDDNSSNPMTPSEPQPTTPGKPNAPSKKSVTPHKPAKHHKPSESAKKEHNNANGPLKHQDINKVSHSENVRPQGGDFAEPKNARLVAGKKKLPQTGDEQKDNLGWLGSLFAGLGLFSLVGASKKRKKKDE